MSFFGKRGEDLPRTRNGVTRHKCGHILCDWHWYTINDSEPSKAIGDIAYRDHIRDEHDSELPELEEMMNRLFGAQS